MTQNPFSFYDFLGYLIPGGLFLFILFLFSIEINPVYIEGILNHILKYKEIISVFIYVVLIVLSYISGHFISILSSCLIEKYMNSKLGYPSIYLFSKRSSLKVKRHNTKFSIVNFIRGVFLFPVSAFDKAEHHKTTLHSILIKVFWPQIRDGYINVFSVSTLYRRKGLRGDLFRLAYHYVYEHSKNHQVKMQNYVALYGFCRNITFVFLASVWLLMFLLLLSFLIDINIRLLPFCFLLLFCIAASRVFYYGFVKYYRRYSLEVLMAFAVLQHDKKTSAISS